MLDVIKRSNDVLNKSATKESEETCARFFECIRDQQYQIDPPTEQFIYGGIYTRTIFIPKGCAVLGALIKIPTTCVLHGDVLLSNGIDVVRSTGFACYKGIPHRRCFAYALEDTYFTTHNPTKATTIEEAEKEFTDEWYLLTTYKKRHNNGE